MSVRARTEWDSGSKTLSPPLCCPGIVCRSSRCAWLMAKLDLLHSGKSPDYWFLCLAVSRHRIALYRLDWPIWGCFPTQTSSLTLTPLIPLLTKCQDFEKMQAQHQREREFHWMTVACDICKTKLSAVIWSFLDLAPEKAMAPHSSTFAWKIPWTGEPGGLPSMGSHRVGHNWSDLAAAAAADLAQPLIYTERDHRGTWAALYTPIHSGPPSSPMSSCSKKGLQCGPKCPILPLYLRVNPLIRFPVGPKDALETYWSLGISFTTILSQTRCVIDFLNFFSAPCDKKKD